MEWRGIEQGFLIWRPKPETTARKERGHHVVQRFVEESSLSSQFSTTNGPAEFEGESVRLGRRHNPPVLAIFSLLFYGAYASADLSADELILTLPPERQSRPELLSEHNFRADGRRPNELRALSLFISPHAQSDGSATVTHGLTSVMVTVHGPHEAPRSKASQLHDRGLLSVQVDVPGWSGASGSGQRRGRNDK